MDRDEEAKQVELAFVFLPVCVAAATASQPLCLPACSGDGGGS